MAIDNTKRITALTYGGVTIPIGLDTSDANVTASGMVSGCSGYADGVKVDGTLADLRDNATFTTSVLTDQVMYGLAHLYLTGIGNSSGSVVTPLTMIKAPASAVASAIQLTAGKLKKDEEVCGITGTYEGSGIAVNVTVDTGAAVTATKGALTVTGTSVNNACTLNLPEGGIWSISAVINGVSTNTVEVNADLPVSLNLPVSVTISSAGTGTSVKNMRSVTINGTVYNNSSTNLTLDIGTEVLCEITATSSNSSSSCAIIVDGVTVGSIAKYTAGTEEYTWIVTAPATISMGGNNTYGTITITTT